MQARCLNGIIIGIVAVLKEQGDTQPKSQCLEIVASNFFCPIGGQNYQVILKFINRNSINASRGSTVSVGPISIFEQSISDSCMYIK
jgi:hypothetical protein